MAPSLSCSGQKPWSHFWVFSPLHSTPIHKQTLLALPSKKQIQTGSHHFYLHHPNLTNLPRPLPRNSRLTSVLDPQSHQLSSSSQSISQVRAPPCSKLSNICPPHSEHSPVHRPASADICRVQGKNLDESPPTVFRILLSFKSR